MGSGFGSDDAAQLGQDLCDLCRGMEVRGMTAAVGGMDFVEGLDYVRGPV